MAAPGTGDHVSASGTAGWVTVAAFAGVWIVAEAVHDFSMKRPFDQRETPPFFPTDRTRHQYFPFGAVVFSVARVFLVEN